MLILTLTCNAPECTSRVDYPEEIVVRQGSDRIDHVRDIESDLHFTAKKLGWHSDLEGDWCRKCATQREVSRLDKATAMGL